MTPQISKPIGDYGHPNLSSSFFKNNPMQVFSVPMLCYNMILNPEIEAKSIKQIYHSLLTSRKEKIQKERKKMEEAIDSTGLLEILNAGIDPINENKPLWDCYHYLKEEYPDNSYSPGPLLALSLLANHGEI